MNNFLKENWIGIIAIILLVLLILYFNAFHSQQSVTLLPPFYFSDSPDLGGMVGASGTFVAKGEELANELNTVEIRCFNRYGDISFKELEKLGLDTSEMYCYIAQADIIDGYLSSALSFYSITDWSPDRVVAESSALCRKSTMVLDRIAKTVTQTGTLINNTGICEGFSSDPIQSYLTDGLEVLK